MSLEEKFKYCFHGGGPHLPLFCLRCLAVVFVDHGDRGVYLFGDDFLGHALSAEVGDVAAAYVVG